MSKVKAVQHIDKSKIGFTEPYPAIQFTGSYNDIIDIIGMIGIENLDFPKNEVELWKIMDKFPDDLLEAYCDRNSNFTLPGKLNKESYPPEKIVIHPRDWVIIKADLLNSFYVDVVDHKHFITNYEVIDYHEDDPGVQKKKGKRK